MASSPGLYGLTGSVKRPKKSNWYVHFDNFAKPLDRPFLGLHPRISNHLFGTPPDVLVNATPGAPVPGLACRLLVFDNQHLEYGDSFEPNSNKQSYRWTDGRLAPRLRRWRHAPDSECNQIARYHSDMLCRLVVFHRL
jgi:hypothetical protein